MIPLCGLITNRLFEALLVLIAWIQLELYALEIAIQARQLRPKFVVELGSSGGLLAERYLVVHNAGPTVAYAVGICRVLDKEHNPVDPARWSKLIRTRTVDVLPGGSSTIAEILDTSILDEHVLEVCYFTDEGLLNAFRIIKHGEQLHVVTASSTEPPGPLLKSIRFLYFAYELMQLKRKMRQYDRALRGKAHKKT